ncbi:MAG: ABC transporter ATP-binding protein [Chloroflexi bacterium]|nr:ABC transporter ATP-binding protein [Chloroflexota bacterium]
MRALLRLLAFMRPYWWGTLVSIVLIFVLTTFRLGPAWFTKLIIDEAVPQRDVPLALWFIAGLLGIALLTNGLNALELYLEQWVGQRVIFDLRGTLYDHLQSQSMSFYDAHQTGQLMSRVTNDVNQVQFFLTQGLARLVNTFVTIGINVAIMAYLDPLLTAVAMLATPLVIYFQKRLARLMNLYRVMFQRQADMAVVIQENVAGIKLVKAFNREPYEAGRFDDVNWDIREKRMATTLSRSATDAGQEFVTYLSAIFIIGLGGWRVMEGAITIGSLAAFYSYVLAMWAPVRWLSFINSFAQQAMAAGERIFEILDTPLDVAEKPNAVALPRLQGRIELDHVSFAYGSNPPLLRDVSFVAEPGQTVALVGRSGSGKTTTVNLIPRFYDPDEGRIMVDGHDVRDVTLRSLRDQIALVIQETFLFGASVKDNIRYGRLDATDEAIVTAAKQAYAHEFITQLHDGYDSWTGEGGVLLSRGQRQRIALARAILKDPCILILDEATSDVDTETEVLIQRALEKIIQGRTTFVIAHRLSTIRHAGQILVLNHGRIVERGTHAELLAAGGHYRQLYDAQFAGQEVAQAQIDRLAAIAG